MQSSNYFSAGKVGLDGIDSRARVCHVWWVIFTRYEAGLVVPSAGRRGSGLRGRRGDIVRQFRRGGEVDGFVVMDAGLFDFFSGRWFKFVIK